MYSEASQTDISKECFCELATLSHDVALDHYPDGPQCCRLSKTTLAALTDAAVSINKPLLNHYIPKYQNIFINFLKKKKKKKKKM
jgi:hypothetical protein